MKQIKERRRERRIKLKIPATVAYNGYALKTYTLNISILGAYLEINRPIKLHQQVAISLNLSALKDTRYKGLIKCEAIVFRCEKLSQLPGEQRYGLGIFFGSFKKDSEKRLAQFINYKIKQEDQQIKEYLKKIKRKTGPGG